MKAKQTNEKAAAALSVGGNTSAAGLPARD